MKQSILGQPPQQYRSRIVGRIVLCAAAAVLTLGLNFTLAGLRTPENHNLLLTVNIVTDILCSWFLLFFITTRIAPALRLYRLTQRQAAKLCGTVEHISQQTVRYMNLDCRQVTADGHRFFLPENTITLETGRLYTFRLVSNTVVEVEQ